MQFHSLLSLSLICLNHNETQRELDLSMSVCVDVCLCVHLTQQRGGGQLANVVAVGFIWHTAVRGIMAILHNMMNKKRKNIPSFSLL